MKQFFKSHAILFSMLAVLIGCLIYPNQADAKTYQTQDNYIGGGGCSVVISNNKVYYSITETGRIFCYDIKTKKTKTIAKASGKGFGSLRKKGNYLYAVYGNYGGSDGSDEYIVRVSIKTGKKTKLARGRNFVFAGKKIYYTKTQHIKTGDVEYDKTIGTYSMSLTGKNKKKAKSVVLNTERDGRTPIKTSKGSLTSRGKTIGSLYFPQAIDYKTSKGKKTEIYNVLKDKNATSTSTVSYYTLQGDYIVYKKYDKKGYSKLVLVKKNGKGAKVIYSAPSVSGW